MRRRARTRVPRTVPPGQLRRTLEAIRRFRTNFVFGTLMVLFVVMLGRLGKLQLLEVDEYRAAAAKRHEKWVDFKRMRGRIVDRFGWPIATSRPIRSVAFDANPEVIRDTWAFAMQSSALLSGEPSAREIQAKIEHVRASAEAENRRAPGYVVLRRHIEDGLLVERLDTVASLSAREKRRLGVYGLLVEREERRRYPNGPALSQLVGRVPPDAKTPRVGIEGHWNEVLAGRDVEVAVRRDNRQQLMIDHEVDRAATRGRDVRLTIDLVVQHHLEGALDTLLEGRSDDEPVYNACGVVIDPHTGEVLAWANRPTRDLNIRAKTREEALRAEMDWVIQGLYEPGSIFKPFTCAWALEHGVVQADTVIPMPSEIAWPGIDPIGDSHFVGDGTVVRLIGESSNTGAAWLAHHLGAKRMTALWTRLGLGRPTGVGLTNEGPSPRYLARWTSEWQRTSPGDVWPEWLSHRAAYGQGFSMTPMQIAGCYCAFARDDARVVRPRVIAAGRLHDPRAGRVCHPKHLAVLRRGLESCVEDGTAREAFAGALYAAAGKTGTSLQRFRPGPGEPIRETNICTFVGYAPADDPQVVAVVLAMVPRGTGSGGSVAAPAVRAVLDATLDYWQVDPAAGRRTESMAEPRGGPLLAPAAEQVMRGRR